MNQNLLIIIILKLAAGAVIALGMMSFAMVAHGAPPVTTTQVFDTSYAVEASSSCLSGGCHEKNSTLMTGYKASYMTHVMVKCNACHGTHTAAELGKPKPNLTGYISGMGATGYKVPKDRCVACHSAASGQGHPNNPTECLSCHAPHQFRR
jgi:nitrate reductase cytochrome c-type subunit